MRTILYSLLVCLLLYITGYTIYKYIKKDSELEQVNKEYKKQRESYLNVIRLYDLKADSLQKKADYYEKQLRNKDSIIYSINKEYEKKYNYVRNLNIDSSIEFFNRYVPKEDVIGKGHSCSDKTDSINSLQYIIY